MHQSSMNQMERFVTRYLDGKAGLKVLDVGALDVNGTYRRLFHAHDYTAMDLVAGPNVDVVGWQSIQPNAYDVVISGQCAEHAENFIQLMVNIGMAAKLDALLCVIVPSRQQVEHRRPDYWRFTKEGAAKLIDFAGADVLEVIEDGRDVVAVGRVRV